MFVKILSFDSVLVEVLVVGPSGPGSSPGSTNFFFFLPIAFFFILNPFLGYKMRFNRCLIVKNGGFLLNFKKNLKLRFFCSFFLHFFLYFRVFFQFFDERSEITVILMIIRHFLQIYFYDSVLCYTFF